MNLSHWKRRWAATLMLTVIVASFVVPAAQAGISHYRRWKPGPNGYSYSVRPVARAYPRASYHRTSSGAAPFVAGLIGGAILGTALSQSHAHASVSASYYDPYCGINFGSLDACRAHFRGCGHPEVIRVVEGGRYSRDLCWQNGGWQDYQGGFRGGDQGGFRGEFSYRSRDGRDDGGRWNDRRDDGRWNDDPRWKDDRGWNDRRGDSRDDARWNDRRGEDDRRGNGRRGEDDRRWNDRRGDDDRRWNDRRDDDDRNFRDRDDDDDSDDDGDN